MKPVARTVYIAIGALAAGGIAFPAPANADEPFMVCPDGHTGVAEGHTSCPFAHDMRVAYENQPGPLYEVYSPVTGETYEMQCQGGFPQISSVVRRSTVCAALAAMTRSFFFGECLFCLRLLAAVFWSSRHVGGSTN